MSVTPAAPDKPKILLVTDRVPGRTAGNEFRVANVVEGLLMAGELHVCLIDSSADGAPFPPDSRFERSVVRAAELPRWLRIVESIWTIPHLRYGNEAALRKKVTEAVDPTEWDVVWFNRARVHRLCSSLFDGAHILDLDDLNDRLLSTLVEDRRSRLGVVRALPRGVIDQLTARRWRRRYRVLQPMVDRLIVCHEGDASHLDASGATVVPNGYPEPDAKPSTPPDSTTMLFVGSLSYEPNYLAVRWFVDHVLDRVRAAVPDASLSVVGAKRDPSQAFDHPAVVVHGWVPDVTPYYDEASITLAPLHSGGGTRIKVIEAMARRRPMVATSFAVEGLGVESGSDVLIADEPEMFADHCIRLLTDDHFAAAQVNCAHRTFSRHHGAGRSIAAVIDVAEAVVAERLASDGPAAR